MARPMFKGPFRWSEPTSTDSTATATVSAASRAEPVRAGSSGARDVESADVPWCHGSGGSWPTASLPAWIAVRMGGWPTSGPQVRQRRTLSLGTGLSCFVLERYVAGRSASRVVREYLKYRSCPSCRARSGHAGDLRPRTRPSGVEPVTLPRLGNVVCRACFRILSLN